MRSFYQLTMVSHPHGSGLFLERGLNRTLLKTVLSTVNCQLSTVNCLTHHAFLIARLLM
ncbi:MAG: hypothetical protein JGK08_09385 [Microcoleus sp. PH2017_04_SCI_O_A]|nr:hypothetical protein [Microcoleus sp. PH2017_04_SCI_O_A]